MQLFSDVSITYKINKMGKNIGNPVPRVRNANIFGKANIPPSVNISTYVGNNTYIFYVFFEISEC